MSRVEFIFAEGHIAEIFENVLNFVEFQNVFTFFRICDGLSCMLTAFGEMILETMFLPKKDTGSTDKRSSFHHDVFYHVRVAKDS